MSLNQFNGNLVVLGGILAGRNEEREFHFYLPDLGDGKFEVAPMLWPWIDTFHSACIPQQAESSA